MGHAAFHAADRPGGLGGGQLMSGVRHKPLGETMTWIKVTPVIRAVMQAVLDAPPGQPAYGLTICEATGYQTGSVYPALNRLRKAGWVTDWWAPPDPDRPPRRFYAPVYDPSWYAPRLTPEPAADRRGFVSTTLTTWWQRRRARHTTRRH